MNLVDTRLIIYKIINDYSSDILLDEKRFLAVFSDYAPNSVLEKKLLSHVYDTGAINCIHKAIQSPNARLMNVKMALSHMLSENCTEEFCHQILKYFFTKEDLFGNGIKTVEDAEDIVEYSDDSDECTVAIDYLRYCAMDGDPHAMFLLGKCYKIANCIEKDDKKAFEWFKKSAEHGYGDGITALGICLEEGISADVDYKLAFKLYERAAALNNSDAYYRLSSFYLSGHGVIEPDEQKGQYYWEKAIQMGNIDAMTIQLATQDTSSVNTKIILCLEKLLNSDLKKRSLWFQRNSGLAMLARAYQFGSGIKKDLDKAIRLYKEFADNVEPTKGGSYAIEQIGLMYYEKNDKQCIDWLKKAAQYNCCRAEYILALIYSNGQLVEEDLKESFRWFKKAAGDGDPKSQCLVGVCYYTGNDDMGIEKDVEKGIFLLELSARGGVKEAAEQLVSIYLYDRSDTDRALYWAKAGAELGSAKNEILLNCYEESQKNVSEAGKGEVDDMNGNTNEAQFNLVMNLLESEPLLLEKKSDKAFREAVNILGDQSTLSIKRIKKAYDLMQYAAERGHIQAAIMLATKEESFEENYEEAYRWYLIAKKNIAIVSAKHISREDQERIESKLKVAGKMIESKLKQLQQYY